MIDKWMKTILALLLLLTSMAWPTTQARAENSWGFGTDIGFLADTLDNEVFTLNFQADYFLDRHFSIGPQFMISPGGNLTQLTFAGIARYYIPLGAVTIIPFGGLGLVHADLDRGRVDDSDTSYTLPFGATAAFHINPKISLASTLLFSLQNLSIDGVPKNDNFNIGLLFGFRFHP